MQVTETVNDSLKREYKIVIPATDLEARTTSRLEELKGQVNIPGFRRGKVPMSIMRKRFGQSVLGEVLEKAVQDSMQKVIEDNALKPALQPTIDVNEAFEPGADLAITMSLEVLPEVGDVDFASITLERETTQVADEKVEEALGTLAEQRKTNEAIEDARPAASGDVAVIDFLGKRDGEPFEGGAAEDYELELGSGAFIPGFEDQVIGVSVGEEKVITVTFPEDYPAEELAGKDVTFDITLKGLKAPVVPALDDELAKTFGKDSLEELRTTVREDLQKEYDEVSRQKVKRKLLDSLAERCTFDVPQGLVDAEFEGIWQQLSQAKEQGQLDEEDAAKSEDELKTEYRGIAERRVRLGLLLADVGQKNEIKVNQEDLNAALMREMRRFPGQEMAVLNYYRQNTQAMEQLRAPVFEDKVCNFIIELAAVTDKPVSPEELLADSEEEEATA